MSGFPEILTVNDFVFCLDHGFEHCNHCYMDHRMTNNFQIEDELKQRLGRDVDDMVRQIQPLHFRPGNSHMCWKSQSQTRPPLNALDYGTMSKKGKESKVECTRHKRADCTTCFDWVKLLEAKMQGKNARGTKGEKELLVHFLDAMGVQNPPTYNITVGALESQLKRAFSFAQDLQVINPPVKPDAFPVWRVCHCFSCTIFLCL